MNTIRYPFNLEEVKALQLDPNGCTSLEIQSTENVYFAVCKYLTDVCNCDSSLRILISDNDNNDKLDDAAKQDGCKLTLGIGVFKTEFESETIHVAHTAHGKPVGTFSAALYLQTLVLIVEGTRKKDLLKKFIDTINEWDTKVNKALINVYSYDIPNQYWAQSIVKRKRGMETVILPASLKQKLLDDVNNFLDKETSKWYAKHGIPYKRSYLLYGPPGTGKTSTIVAMASNIDRHVAYLHIADPEMTDSALKKALQRVPKNSVVVLEDVDALFSADRSKLENIPLSFSGLLNALDGIGGKDASIFVLTTNHIDRLDPALIRPGRVDMHLAYPSSITDEQIELMFKQFYPEATKDLVQDFVEKVGNFRSAHRNISTATLQQYFIAHRTSDAQEAVTAVEGGMPMPYIKPDLASLMYN